MTNLEMSGAKFSEDRKYRQLLWRIWDNTKPLLLMIMLNPSKAGALITDSDPTVTRQIGRAKRLGCGGLLVVNAYDLVATDPHGMKRHPCPLSAEANKEIIIAADRTLASGGYVVCAWGGNIDPERQAELLRILAGWKLHCLGTNADGTPVHPLYKAYNTPLQEFAA